MQRHLKKIHPIKIKSRRKFYNKLYVYFIMAGNIFQVLQESDLIEILTDNKNKLVSLMITDNSVLNHSINKHLKTKYYNLSKKNNLNVKKIKLNHQNDDQILEKNLVNEIYRFAEKRIIVVNDINLEQNFLVYIDKIENVNINEKPEEYKKHLNLSKIKISSNLFNSYDSYIKKKYNIDWNRWFNSWSKSNLFIF